MTVDAIKDAITGLPEEEKASLVAWLNQEDIKAWDKQMESDFSECGAGSVLLEAWDNEIEAGGLIPLEEFLAQEQAARKRKNR